MKVVLLRPVPNLGQPGEIKIVRDGFAANFLIPQKLVEAIIPSYQPAVPARAIAPVASGRALSSLDRATISLSAKASDAKNLYGGITAGQICDQVKLQLGFDLSQKQLVDFKALKHVGHFQIRLKAGQQQAWLNVVIKAEADEQ